MPEAVAPTTSVGSNPIPPQAVSNMTVPAPGTLPDATPAAKAAEKDAQTKKIMKLLKVDGREIEMDEDQITRFATKGVAAEKRFAEASKIMKDIETRAKQIEERENKLSEREKRYQGDVPDWDYLIEQSSGDPKKLALVREKAENWLIEQIKMDGASPEQQEALRTRQENERLRKENEDFKNQKKKEELDSLTQKHREAFETNIIQALDMSGLPPTENNVRKMADLMIKSVKGKYNIAPEQLAQMVKQDLISDNKAIAGDYADNIVAAYKAKDTERLLMLAKNLEELYPESLFQALRAIDLTRLSSAQPHMPKQPLPTPETKQPNETKAYPMTWEQEIEHRKKVAAQLDAEWRRS